MNKWVRYLSILHIQKIRFPGCSVWYNKWKKNIIEFDNVIIFDRNYNWNIIKYIHKKNPDCRIIVWYWNPIGKIKRVPQMYRKYCEEWSFDLDDCREYQLHYNTQFSFLKQFLSVQSLKLEQQFDMYFLGYDKGRMPFIYQIETMMYEEGLKPYFIVVKDSTSKSIYKYADDVISYKKNIDLLKVSKCILELVQSGQKGLTVRCIEALFLNKKLITNNKDIKNYDFYHPNNILVIDQTFNKDILKNFLKKKYVNIPSQLIEKYDFSGWLNNFNL